ncbi:hypothetical protein DID97_24705 [Burkholderia sp. Bp8977]|nr:hypothetical protein DIE10_27475 [Burkholderia sp. Bp9011]RQR87322.1 hypothetical protein DIE09_28440 [Burkholderia sp. Bp9010]RQS69731.1 hypothetical protein DID97_24705 [Burkholderia sp. Bp8977]
MVYRHKQGASIARTVGYGCQHDVGRRHGCHPSDLRFRWPMPARKRVHEGNVAAEVAHGQKACFDALQISSVAYTDPRKWPEPAR